MYLVKINKFEDKYFTINKKDRTSFLSCIDDIFEEDKEFEIIYDKEELKEILNKEFMSKGRGENYEENFTSVTKITSSLFPLELASSKGLLNWYKNISVKDYKLQQEQNEIAMNMGTHLHACIENILISNKNKEKRNIYKNIKETKGDYHDVCTKALLEYKKYKYKPKDQVDIDNNNWIYNELDNIECVHSELFLKDNDLQIQGCVDGLWIYNNKITLEDIKTTSKINKKTGNGEFKSPSQIQSYHRQLAIYSYLLTKHKYITKKELSELLYRIDMFSFVKEEYRVYDFENKYILGLIKPTMKVLEWVNSNK